MARASTQATRTEAAGFALLRPIVRYVDEDQAVVELHVRVKGWPVEDAPPDAATSLLVQIHEADGSVDDQCLPLVLTADAGMVSLTIVRPSRWWPAGMGAQALCDLQVSLLVNNEVRDARTVRVGLTSVRPEDMPAGNGGHALNMLVNGQPRPIRAVVAVDQADERGLLRVNGDALLLVRGHYGPDVLYDAADRAGILLVQCVPLHADGRPETDVPDEVLRLATHPSLAGWFVGHLGRIADRVGQAILALDPVHPVLRVLPRVS